MNFFFGIQGRIGRLQWWGAQLIIFILLAVPFFIVGMGVSDMSEERIRQVFASNGLALIIMFLAFYVLAVWMNVAVTVKRYHDRNKSGFWFLIVFIPFIGGIWQLVECGFLSGTGGANDYGQRGGGNAFGDYLDNGDPEPGPLRRPREEPVRQRQAAASPVASTQTTRPVGRHGSTGFGRRGLS
jgi:uncharacterized membrane protein YhaH (DUF805 family)